MMKKITRFILFPAAALGAGGISGFLTKDAMQAYDAVNKPALTPPAIVFPIVWTILYVLMGISMALVWEKGSLQERQALALWTVQLAMNFCWSLIFFNAQAYGVALLWLIVLWLVILAMIVVFYSLRPLAGLLQLPYLLWAAFAGYLNFMIWQLNP